MFLRSVIPDLEVYECRLKLSWLWACRLTRELEIAYKESWKQVFNQSTSRQRQRSLALMSSVIPDKSASCMQGVVVFFPSFAYREEVQRQWASYGLIRQLSARKKVFVEPRATGQVESMLRDYSECIAGKGSALPMKGAVLLCVVGGKMSEGINFGDGLGR